MKENNRRPFSGWEGFHKRKRIAKKLFKRWQATNLQYVIKAWPFLEHGKSCDPDCYCCDQRTFPDTIFFWEKVSYEENEWESYCSVCAFDKIHEYDDFDACMKDMDDCGQWFSNPTFKSGKKKYDRCPKCGGDIISNREKELEE